MDIFAQTTEHGRATFGTGHANLREFLKNGWHDMARPCHFWNGPCQPSSILGSKFFHFLESFLDNYLQNNFK